VTGVLHIGHAITAAIEVVTIYYMSFSFFVVCYDFLSLMPSYFDSGCYNSLAEDVRLQCFMGSWNGPCWHSNPGIFLFTRLISSVHKINMGSQYVPLHEAFSVIKISLMVDFAVLCSMGVA
jgi:hypothetical protein